METFCRVKNFKVKIFDIKSRLVVTELYFLVFLQLDHNLMTTGNN